MQVFPAYDHPGLKNVKGPIQRGLAFNEWFRLFKNRTELASNLPYYCKVIYHQYLEVMGGIPESSRYRPGFYFDYYSLEQYHWITKSFNDKFINSLLPNIKFILLRRRNLFAHAVSLYLARQTKQYHIYDEQTLKAYRENKVQLDKTLLLACWQDANEYYGLWDNFLSQPALLVDYEDLADRKVLVDVADYLGISVNLDQVLERANQSNKRIYKMGHPLAPEYEKELRMMLLKVL